MLTGWRRRGVVMAAREPRRLLTLTLQDDDGLGGHVTALYEQMDWLMPLLRETAGVP